MMGFSKKLDGKTLERGQEATGHCGKCMDDRTLKRWHELENIMLEEGATELAAVFAQKIEKAWEHIRQHQVVVRKKHAGHDLGAREFTLTYSPKWMDDATARQQMTTAIDRLRKYYRTEILDFQVVGETGKNGLSHIHGYYLLARGKKMTDKNFQRAWKYWNPKKKIGNGFEGGHHAVVKSESNFKGYIGKEENPWYEYNHENGKDQGSEEGHEGTEA